MNENRKSKCLVVENLKGIFDSNNIVIITHNNGLNAAEVKDFRKKIKNSGSMHQVVKKTLLKIAVKDTKFAELDAMIEGPVNITYSSNVVEAAKVVHNFAKSNDKIKICGGMTNGVLMDSNALTQLSLLPSLDELKGKILALLGTPGTKIAQVIQAPGSQIARVLSAYSTK